MFTHCVWRSQNEQNKVNSLGHSKAKYGHSPHNFGMAADIIHSLQGWELSEKEWDVIGLLGKDCARSLGIKIKWGGDFANLYDPAHWELADWKQQRKIGFSNLYDPKIKVQPFVSNCTVDMTPVMPTVQPRRTPEMARADMLKGPSDIYQRTYDGRDYVYVWTQQIGRYKRSWALTVCPYLTTKHRAFIAR